MDTEDFNGIHTCDECGRRCDAALYPKTRLWPVAGDIVEDRRGHYMVISVRRDIIGNGTFLVLALGSEKLMKFDTAALTLAVACEE
jgi:hypothetical protein